MDFENITMKLIRLQNDAGLAKSAGDIVVHALAERIMPQVHDVPYDKLHRVNQYLSWALNTPCRIEQADCLYTAEIFINQHKAA